MINLQEKSYTDPSPYMFFAGVLQADPGVIRDAGQIFRLFCHEAQRVFHDRLINREDKRYFNAILSEMAQKHFSQVQFWNMNSMLFTTKSTTWHLHAENVSFQGCK